MRAAQRIATMPWTCADCGNSPVMIAGFKAFAPDLALENEGFREEYFGALAELEAGNFWFRARNDLIVWALQTYFPDRRTFLEIGCGTGFVLAGIHAADPSIELSGSEIFSAGLAFAAARVPSAQFSQMDARHIPFRDEFDVIGAFDVLEHIEDDESVIAEVGRALRPGGGFLVSVRSIRRSGARRMSTPITSGATRRASFDARSRRPASRSCE